MEATIFIVLSYILTRPGARLYFDPNAVISSKQSIEAHPEGNDYKVKHKKGYRKPIKLLISAGVIKLCEPLFVKMVLMLSSGHEFGSGAAAEYVEQLRRDNLATDVIGACYIVESLLVLVAVIMLLIWFFSKMRSAN